MLIINCGRGARDCEGSSRRDFLRVGSLAVGGLSLPTLLAARANAGEADYVHDRSVVLLYLSGGASHIETFDPKMTAPDGIRSVTGEVKTPLPGVTFGGTFPQLASLANKMAVVRSHAHPIGGHEQAHVHVLSGGTDPQGTQATGQSFGSVYARIRGTNHPRTGMPTYTLLTEREVDGQYSKEKGRVLKGTWPGQLGPSYAPFGHEIGWEESASGKNDRRRSQGKSENAFAAAMKLNLSEDALDDRMSLLGKIDRLKREADNAGNMGAVDHFNEQAINLVLGGASEAFDFEKEDPKLVSRYDTSHIRIGHKVFRPSTLGKQLLVARRLCEAGCGFVTVHSAGWDMHADGNNPGMTRGMEMLGRTLDQAASTFIEDIHARGLDKKILFVIVGDFGRTPKVNNKGGRDHWAQLGTLAFAGGGLNMGQVIGQSARGADVPATEPINASHLMATVFHSLFDVGKLRLDPSVPADLSRLVQAHKPIGELF